MLQEVRIRRMGHDRDEDGGVPLAEWLHVLASDEELESLDFIMGRNPRTGEPVRVLLTGGARWTANPDCDPLPFFWEFGQVVAYSADSHTVAKAQQLARRLAADCHLSSD
jgi:hypothetical protein